MMTDILEDLSARIAKYAYECSNGENSWQRLSVSERFDHTQWAWHSVFKQERRFADPVFEIRGTAGKRLLEYPNDRFASLDKARERARSLVNDENQIVSIVELVEREVTCFYQHVVKTVVEEES